MDIDYFVDRPYILSGRFLSKGPNAVIFLSKEAQMSRSFRVSVLCFTASLAFVLGVALPAISQEPFRFVVLGDTRSDHASHKAVVAQALRLDPEFVINTGDLVSDGRNINHWKVFLDIVKPLRAVAPYYPVIGNHDHGGAVANIFGLPDEDGTYYYFAHENALFIMLDTTAEFSEGSPQHTWLKKRLDSAKEDHIFVSFHHPSFGIKASRRNNRAVIDAFHELFVKNNVRTVFNGHDHYYYRTHRDGVTYTVIGGGGAPLYDPDPSLTIEGDVWGKYHHCMLVEVNGPEVRGTVYTKDGEVKDSFLLRK